MAERTKNQFVYSERLWDDPTNETDIERVNIRPRKLIGLLSFGQFNQGKNPNFFNSKKHENLIEIYFEFYIHIQARYQNSGVTDSISKNPMIPCIIH